MAYLLFLNVIMLTRLGYLTREDPAPTAYAWPICLLQILSLGLFSFQWPLVLLAIVLVAATALNQLLEHRGRHLAGTRALTFVIFAAAGAVLLDTAALAPWSIAFLHGISSATVWTAALDPAQWHQANLVLFALLVLTNEVNLGIRYGFYRLNLEPKENPGGGVPGGSAAAPAVATDQRQYNAGRVIGILERYFLLTLLLGGAELAAIAVILAAKGFARFKQMDRREFAEYVLIGTLASTLAAALVAALVNHLLS